MPVDESGHRTQDRPISNYIPGGCECFFVQKHHFRSRLTEKVITLTAKEVPVVDYE